ncbi:MAG: MotA/TolQ/ExbB proton channel family protein [Desulforhopalus sp.]
MLEIILKGGVVMYPLLACSVCVLTIIIERALFWVILNRRHNSQLITEVLESCQQGDWELVKKKTIGSKDYAIRVLVSGIVHRKFSMTKAMEVAAIQEIVKMRRGIGVLDTMITVAPLLGILGTVIGIILSFDMLAIEGIENPQAVTGGIAQALITTATGLTIAILAVIPFNYFNVKVEQAVQKMEQYATSLEIVYEKLLPDSSNGDNL